MLKRSTLTILALFIFTTGAFAQATVAVTTGFDEAAARRTASFEKVWNTINERHYDPTFGGVNWQGVRAKYEPLAKKAETDEALHALLRQMLGELKLSHFGIFPKGLSADEMMKSNGTVGIDIVYFDGDAVVDRVEPGSPAANAGIVRGFILNKIDGRSVSSILNDFDATQRGRKLTEAMRIVYRERMLESRLNGKPGTSVVAEFVDAKDSAVTVNLERTEFRGEMSQPFGNFPPQPVIFESRSLDGNIGYVRFNMWIVPQMAKLRQAVREFAGANGIIVDLRGNPGGIGGMASGLAGMMVSEEFSLGTMRTRENSISFIAYPQPKPFSGPVAILTDHGSGSTSEVFAAGMQESGRAKVIGETTAGAVLPSVFDTLPTGAIFQYAVSDYRSPKNILIEGRGVFPDITVSRSRSAMLAGRDAQLEKAIEYINANKK
jgi:carboxyl-terminal processing protease